MSEQKNILLVQLFSNGDCLYATAVARQIKQDYPGCKLTWAIASFCKDIIKNNPYVDEVLVTDEVPKSNAAAFRRYKRKVQEEKKAGKWDEVFITTNMDTNLALYDGTIRGMILRAYRKPITVPLQIVLSLTDEEKQRTKDFAEQNKLSSFSQVILWEYAPQSGQSELNFEMVMSVAKRLTSSGSVCIILSSANKFESSRNIIDASVLSIRENAALTHYCTLLVGCSSGITWLTTSTDAKFLPMLQLLNPEAAFINKPSEDFKRFGIVHNGLIETGKIDSQRIYDYISTIIDTGFSSAQQYHEELPLQFNTSRKIIYNLLVYREFAAVREHYRIMKSVYGSSVRLSAVFAEALVTFPFKLMGNLVRKKNL